ncbi:hypothetical protein [Rhodoferax sp.]|nr:hypothetical protein [Rhodoferax sp.]MBE0473798.1 hypothetical protein [Rhodoferax sp.]
MNRCLSALDGLSYWQVALQTTSQVLIHSFTPTALAQENGAGTVPLNQ